MDFKGGLAAFTVAASRLARAKVSLRRDIILLAEADEEGGSYGTSWLAKENYAKIDAGVSLNEGGWIFEDGGGTPRLMGITAIDKNSLSVTLNTRGNSTHSSRPLPDSALARLTRALNRIERYEPATPKLSPTAKRYPRAWARGFGGRSAATSALLAARTAEERRVATRRLARGNYGELFNGLLRTIYVPTIVDGGFRANVLPGGAEATVNIRLLPGARPRPRSASSGASSTTAVRATPIPTQTGESVEEVLDSLRRARAPGALEHRHRLLPRARARGPAANGRPPRVAAAQFEAGTDAVPVARARHPRLRRLPVPWSRAPQPSRTCTATTSGSRSAGSSRAPT